MADILKSGDCTDWVSWTYQQWKMLTKEQVKALTTEQSKKRRKVQMSEAGKTRNKSWKINNVRVEQGLVPLPNERRAESKQAIPLPRRIRVEE